VLMTLSSTSGLSEAEQVRALERYQILRPFADIIRIPHVVGRGPGSFSRSVRQ